MSTEFKMPTFPACKNAFKVTRLSNGIETAGLKHIAASFNVARDAYPRSSIGFESIEKCLRKWYGNKYDTQMNECNEFYDNDSYLKCLGELENRVATENPEISLLDFQ